MPSILSLPPAPELYAPFYEGETIHIHASDEEIQGENAEQWARTMEELVRHHISIILGNGVGTQAVREHFIVTEAGGVLDGPDAEHPGGGTVVPMLFWDEMNADGSHPRYTVDGNTQRMLMDVRMNDPGTRLVVTSAGDIPTELFSVGGKGTLVIARERLVADTPTDKEKCIVRYVIDRLEQLGIFRPRTGEEKNQAVDHHLVLREHTPLTGCSLIGYDDDSVELGAMWSGYNGMGKILAKAAQDKFLAMFPAHRTLFALTTPDDVRNPPENDPALRRFVRYGFRPAGKLSDAKTSGRAPAHLDSYDTGTRNPYLFIYENPAPGSGSKGIGG